jgi:hypothetical protein
VILLFRNEETGVDKSSRLDPTGVVLISGRAPLRDNGVVAAGGADPATRGVNGVLLEVFAVALRVGMRGRMPFCLSYGGMFALPLFAANGLFCRIMAL